MLRRALVSLSFSTHCYQCHVRLPPDSAFGTFFLHIFAVVYAFYNVSFILTLFAGNLTPLTPKRLLEIVET